MLQMIIMIMMIIIIIIIITVVVVFSRENHGLNYDFVCVTFDGYNLKFHTFLMFLTVEL
jgi:hypothetical protein